MVQNVSRELQARAREGRRLNIRNVLNSGLDTSLQSLTHRYSTCLTPRPPIPRSSSPVNRRKSPKLPNQDPSPQEIRRQNAEYLKGRIFDENTLFPFDPPSSDEDTSGLSDSEATEEVSKTPAAQEQELLTNVGNPSTEFHRTLLV